MIDPFVDIGYDGAPFISKITNDLWMGGIKGEIILPPEVQHYVSLFSGESYLINHNVLTERYWDLQDIDDHGAIDADVVLEITDWVNECRKTGITFVHCQGGFNRSGLIVGAALVRSGMTPDEAIRLLWMRRSTFVLYNRAFREFIEKL